MQIPKLAQTLYPTPVLNTPNFHECFGGSDGKTIPFNENHLLKAVETVLLPGAHLALIEKMKPPHIYRICAADYPYSHELYIDERFVSLLDQPIVRHQQFFSPEQLLLRMKNLIGTSYIWGGNWPEGIAQLLEFYPPSQELDPLTQATWTLKGVDCSGLLYYVSGGTTPRNTSTLLNIGQGLPIEGLKSKEIISLVQPMDLIVWKGHVVYVEDKIQTIESRVHRGVINTEIEERFEEIFETKTPVNEWSDPSHFVIRRLNL